MELGILPKNYVMRMVPVAQAESCATKSSFALQPLRAETNIARTSQSFRQGLLRIFSTPFRTPFRVSANAWDHRRNPQPRLALSVRGRAAPGGQSGKRVAPVDGSLIRQQMNRRVRRDCRGDAVVTSNSRAVSAPKGRHHRDARARHRSTLHAREPRPLRKCFRVCRSGHFRPAWFSSAMVTPRCRANKETGVRGS